MIAVFQFDQQLKNAMFMEFIATKIPYEDTRSFSSLVLDYISRDPLLKPFYAHTPDIDGVRDAIEARKNFSTDRHLLVEQLKLQYTGIHTCNVVTENIDALLSEDTFTITTAHQPNIFLGHLYFVYKILHAIRIADELTRKLPGFKFVPVYYMGSEDADLHELGEVKINGKAYTWQTAQKGAVGRMLIDQSFMEIVTGIEGQLAIETFGPEIIMYMKAAYTPGKTIQQATFEFTHTLFQDYGLLILLPDNAALKRSLLPVIRKELSEGFSHKAVLKTITSFPTKYKVQASGREVNLFYLEAGMRERIEKEDDGFRIANSSLRFTHDEFEKEIVLNPQRVSPNVILRPVYQELVLPNIVFIGGGGELAYWLELKKVFEDVDVPYPLLVLRNSFTIIPFRTAELMQKLNLTIPDVFEEQLHLINQLIFRDSDNKLTFSEEKLSLIKLYKQFRSDATVVDTTLERHVWALQSKAIQKIEQLEKKMLKATRTRSDAMTRQVQKLKSQLSPGGSLQERYDNILPYYAIYGKSIIKVIYDFSGTFEHKFNVITEINSNS